VWQPVAVTLAITLWFAPGAAEAQETPGPPHQTNLTIGQPPPSLFTLQSIDLQSYDLEAALGERAILLLFFRGTW
jgi:hypothetical protein